MYAEIFPPGDFIKEELEARNWTQKDLAKILGKSTRLVNEVVNAKRIVTPETAKVLAGAFGTSAQLWLNLESAWQLFQLQSTDEDVPRRARLYDEYPVKEIIKRGWIEDSESIDVLEHRFCDFFQIGAVSDKPELAGVFRRSDDNNSLNGRQLAWLYRAYQIAESLQVQKFSAQSLDRCFTQLRSIMREPEEIRHVPKILSECGIRFLIVEPISPGSKVDGVCFWVNDSPVVVLSLRIGRIDSFWFTLIHELRHVANGDGKSAPIIDLDLAGTEATSEVEILANKEASDYLAPALENFIDRVSPIYSTQKIVGFSNLNNIHPGIVVGQLQNRKEILYSHYRKMLVDIRDIVIPSSIVDGWGNSLSTI